MFTLVTPWQKEPSTASQATTRSPIRFRTSFGTLVTREGQNQVQTNRPSIMLRRRGPMETRNAADCKRSSPPSNNVVRHVPPPLDRLCVIRHHRLHRYPLALPHHHLRHWSGECQGIAGVKCTRTHKPLLLSSRTAASTRGAARNLVASEPPRARVSMPSTRMRTPLLLSSRTAAFKRGAARRTAAPARPRARASRPSTRLLGPLPLSRRTAASTRGAAR